MESQHVIMLMVLLMSVVHRSSAIHIQFSQRLVGFTFMNQTGVSLSSCMSGCEARRCCSSVNYKRNTNICEMNYRLASPNSALVVADEYVYSTIKDHLNGGYCNESCQPDGSCAPDLCLTFQAPSSSRYLGNMNTVGSRAIVSWPAHTCQFPYKSYTVRLRCSGNGQWIQEPFSADDLRGTCMRVFRADSQDGGDFYDTWTTGNQSSSNLHCFDSGSCQGIHYRNDVIDNWQNLNISTVRFSVYKHDKEVKYVIFNATNSNSINWFSHSRIIESSWHSLMSARVDIVSLAGMEISQFLKRRFYILSKHGGCSGDIIWFSASTRVAGGCSWDGEVQSDPPATVTLVCSQTDQPERAANTTNVGHADSIAVALCF